VLNARSLIERLDAALPFAPGLARCPPLLFITGSFQKSAIRSATPQWTPAGGDPSPIQATAPVKDVMADMVARSFFVILSPRITAAAHPMPNDLERVLRGVRVDDSESPSRSHSS